MWEIKEKHLYLFKKMIDIQILIPQKNFQKLKNYENLNIYIYIDMINLFKALRNLDLVFNLMNNILQDCKNLLYHFIPSFNFLF